MSDELDLPPETKALARLVGRVANAAFDKALEGDVEGFEVKVDAAMEEARPAIADDDALRQEHSLQLCKQAMRINKELVLAIREGREEDVERLKAAYSSLQLQMKELTRYLGFTATAEALHRAKDFDAFLAALPSVDLARTYGGASPTFAPFPIIWALEARDRPVERVQAMLKAGARLDLTTKFPKFTVLHWVAQSKRKGREKRLACVRLLVLKGADLEAKDMFGRTPLHVAIGLGSLDDMAVLLEAGASVRALSGDREVGSIDGQSRTTLMKAAGDPAKMQLLLDHGADPDQRAADGLDLRLHIRQQVALFDRMVAEEPEKKRAVSYLAKQRDALAASLALVEPLIGPHPVAPDRKLTFSEAPEAFYALQGDLPLDEYRATLAKVDITTYTALNGDCPIYWPIRAKVDRPERLWLMLKAGASVEGDPDNGTALHILADEARKNAEEQARMVAMLVQAGALLEQPDYAGLTPLARAVQHGGLAEAAALLAAGASVRAMGCLDFMQRRKAPLLMVGAADGKLFRLLLQHGADPEQRAADGQRLDDWITAEITRLEANLREDLSGNLRRTWERDLRGFRASQAMLAQARAGRPF